jgi:hypothetical protein
MPTAEQITASLSPVPLALVSFQAPSGRLCLLPAGWVGLVCASPNLVTVGMRAAAHDLLGVQPGLIFTVSLPAQHTRRQAGAEPDSPSLQVECRLRALDRRFEQAVFSGDVVAVRHPGGRVERGGEVPLCTLYPGVRAKPPGRVGETRLDNPKDR